MAKTLYENEFIEVTEAQNGFYVEFKPTKDVSGMGDGVDIFEFTPIVGQKEPDYEATRRRLSMNQHMILEAYFGDSAVAMTKMYTFWQDELRRWANLDIIEAKLDGVLLERIVNEINDKIADLAQSGGASKADAYVALMRTLFDTSNLTLGGS